MNIASTRLWRCSECGEVERISIQIDDPLLCSVCMLNATKRDQEVKPKPTAKTEIELFIAKNKNLVIVASAFGALMVLGFIGQLFDEKSEHNNQPVYLENRPIESTETKRPAKRRTAERVSEKAPELSEVMKRTHYCPVKNFKKGLK